MLTNLALAAASLAVGLASDGQSASNLAAAPSTTALVAGDSLPDAADAVSIKTKDGQLLSGSFYAPKKKKKSTAPAPGLLLLHDAGEKREGLEELATYYHKKGFAVLTVDLRGHGDSANADCSFKDSDETTRETLWGLSTRDVDAAADYLLDQDRVHASNLSIIGFGAGAALAVRRAIDDESVRSVILVDPTPSAFGYNLANGIVDLGGLPTLIMAPKDKRDIAKRLQQAAHADSEGLEFVDVQKMKLESKDVLKDTKLDSQTAGWLREQVMPKK